MHTVSLAIILLLIIIIISYHCVKQKEKSIKMGNNEIKKVRIKNCAWYYFDDIIKLEDFDLDNILMDEKSHENKLIYDILYKTLISSKPLQIRWK